MIIAHVSWIVGTPKARDNSWSLRTEPVHESQYGPIHRPGGAEDRATGKSAEHHTVLYDRNGSPLKPCVPSFEELIDLFGVKRRRADMVSSVPGQAILSRSSGESVPPEFSPGL